MLSKVSVLFLQEVWLSDGQMQELANIDNHFLFNGRSGFDDSEVLTGRPYGGVAILWRSDLAAKIAVIDTNSKRVCAVRMESDNFKLLFINVYMPYEHGRNNWGGWRGHVPPNFKTS
jgi:exonuclease III